MNKRTRRIAERDEYVCGAHVGGCGQSLRGRRITVDHIVPRKFMRRLAGDNANPNHDWNLQVMCAECNNKKGGQVNGLEEIFGMREVLKKKDRKTLLDHFSDHIDDGGSTHMTFYTQEKKCGPDCHSLMCRLSGDELTYYVVFRGEPQRICTIMQHNGATMIIGKGRYGEMGYAKGHFGHLLPPPSNNRHTGVAATVWCPPDFPLHDLAGRLVVVMSPGSWDTALEKIRLQRQSQQCAGTASRK